MANTADLTLDELYCRTERHLIDHGHPRPRRHAVEAAGELKLPGDTQEHRCRRVAETGNADAMVRLGALVALRGDLTDAERWWRKAADNGDTRAMTSLGYLFERRDDLSDAEHWYRKAADNGDTDAMPRLGYVLERRGERTEAEHCYRKAADTGDLKKD